MLPGQDGGGDHNGALLAVQHALKDRPQRHLRLAKAHVPAEQPIHGAFPLHVPLDFGGAPQLVLRLVVLEPLLKLPLPVPVGGKGEALGLEALGVKLNQLLCHIGDRLLHPLACFAPGIGIQFIEADPRVLPAADVLGHQVQLGDGDKEGIGTGVPDFDVILDEALNLFFDDPLKDADAVGRMDHIVPWAQVGDVLDDLALVLFGAGLLFAPQPLGGPTVGDGRQPVAGVLEAGGKAPLADQHLTGGEVPRLRQEPGGDAVLLEIGGEGHRPPAGAAPDIDAVPLLQVVAQVLQKGVQLSPPDGKGVGLQVRKLPQTQAGVAAGEAVQQQGGDLFVEGGQLPIALGKTPRHPGEAPLLQQGLDVLVLQKLAVEKAFLDSRPLAYRQEARPQVIQEAGSLGVDKGDVPVGAAEVPALLQPGDVPLQHGTGGLPLLFGEAVQVLLQQPRQLLGGVKELPGGGKGHLGKIFLPPLAFRGEGGDGVNLIPPELHPHRLGQMGGPEVQNPAPDGELAGPLHLLAPGVPRPQEGAHQLILGQLLPWQQGDGAFLQHCWGDGGLERRHRGGDGDGPALRRQTAEHRKAQLLVLPAYPLHLPQGELPLRVVAGQGLPQEEVYLLAEAQGALFVLGEEQCPPPLFPAKGRQKLGLVDHGPPGEKHRPAPALKGRGYFFVLLPRGDKRFNHSKLL